MIFILGGAISKCSVKLCSEITMVFVDVILGETRFISYSVDISCTHTLRKEWLDKGTVG